MSVANFLHALAAVLIGNLLYYLLMPYLPYPARHEPMHLDLGALVDFGLCLMVLGIIKALAGRPHKTGPERS
jgi:hypothetical protein